MAEAEEKNKTEDETESKEDETESKKDQVDTDTLVWDPNAVRADGKKGDYVKKYLSPELYRQAKAAERRQALIAGGTGLAAEGIQFAIGQSIFDDPSIKAAQADKARLAAQLRKDPDYLTRSEKAERRQAALAPVERRSEALQRRAEAIAASTGDVSVRSLLAAGETGIAQMRQQALDTEAQLAQEDITRMQLKEQQDEKARKGIAEVDAMMLELRNKYIREPLHKFIADAGKVAGTMMAYAPARNIDDQVAELRSRGVSEKEISKFLKLARRSGPRKTEKAFDAALGTLPPAADAKNKELEMQRALEVADAAISKTRGEREEATGPAIKPKGKSIMDMTEEEIKAEIANLPESEFDRKRREREEAEDLQGQRIIRTGAYTRSDMNPRVHGLRVAQSFDKGDYTYVYDLEKKVWTVYKDDKKLDFEVSLDEAKASDDPNVRELYDVALVNNLLLDEDLAESMA